jgi:hypothetical protein
MNIPSSISGNIQMPQSTKMATPPNTLVPSPTRDSDGDTDGSTASATTSGRLLDISV